MAAVMLAERRTDSRAALADPVQVERPNCLPQLHAQLIAHFGEGVGGSDLGGSGSGMGAGGTGSDCGGSMGGGGMGGGGSSIGWAIGGSPGWAIGGTLF